MRAELFSHSNLPLIPRNLHSFFPFKRKGYTGTKIISEGHLFTHENGDLGAISVTERSCAALVSKVTYRIGVHTIPDNSTFSLPHEKQSRVPARGTQHGKVVETLGTL